MGGSISSCFAGLISIYFSISRRRPQTNPKRKSPPETKSIPCMSALLGSLRQDEKQLARTICNKLAKACLPWATVGSNRAPPCHITPNGLHGDVKKSSPSGINKRSTLMWWQARVDASRKFVALWLHPCMTFSRFGFASLSASQDQHQGNSEH